MNRAVFSQLLRSLLAMRSTNERPFDISGLSAAEQDAAYRHFAAARSRLEGATQLHEAGRYLPALLLYREGLVVLARVMSVARGAEPRDAAADPSESLAHFASMLESDHASLAAALRDSLRIPDGTELDALPSRALEMRANALSNLAAQLIELLEPKSRERSLLAQYAPAASFFLTLLVMLGTASYYALQPTNIAKGKAATASSSFFDTRPEGAVDGKSYGNFGFHSVEEESPWLRVDLGRLYRITSVKIFGRHDCCYEQSVPMVFEVSGDGEHFRDIATRVEPFQQVEPWIIFAKGASARYVRVRSLNPTVLVLSEVEVYGKPIE